MDVTNQKILIAGDITALTVVTLVGFIRHGTISTAGERILFTLVPLCLAWFMTAPFFDVYDQTKAAQWNYLWRPLYAIILACPLAACLRGALLNTPIQVVFITVMALFSSLGILVWRVFVILLKPSQG